MHRKLKETKSDKIEKVLDLLTNKLGNDEPMTKNEEPLSNDLQLALNGLGDESSDVEVLPPVIKPEEKKEAPVEPAAGQKASIVQNTSSSPAVFANFDSRRKIHGFILDLTCNKEIKDEVDIDKTLNPR